MPTDASIVSDSPPKPEEYLTFLRSSTGAPPATGACSFDLVVALAAKGFVILTGQSGTGKSRSAIELGQGLDVLEEYGTGVRGSSYELVAVGADWTDARPLLGYSNPFGTARKDSDGETTHLTYEIPDALRLIIRAAAPSTAPVPCVLILDEMNLSHVERYFSPFLSIIEANRSSAPDAAIPLLPMDRLTLIAEVLESDEPNSPETIAAQELISDGRGLQFPQNLMVVGTVNVDETTYMFSPKVLDRAHVMELHSVQPNDYFANKHSAGSVMATRTAFEFLAWAIANRNDGVFDQHPDKMFEEGKKLVPGREAEVDALANAAKAVLQGAYRLLDPIGFGFGFRTINEVCSYLLSWIKGKTLITTGDVSPVAGWQDALDTVFLQKVLPKIHGNRRQFGDSLLALQAFLAGGDENSKPPAKYKLGTSEAVGIAAAEKLPFADAMPKSRTKLDAMLVQLQATGYATFIR
jgi:hypothetical protein